MADPDLDDLERRMNGAVEVLRQEFGGLRTGRASASLLEPIVVAAYGSQMPLNQVATINVPEPRMLSVQVWDKSMLGANSLVMFITNLYLHVSESVSCLSP